MPAFVVLAVLSLSPWDIGGEVCPGDLARFPADAAMAEECVAVAYAHREWIDQHATGLPWANAHQWRSEANRSLDAWSHLRWAWYYFEHREDPAEHITHELLLLRDVIGPENYRAGVMPDPIPYRRVMHARP